MVNKIITIEDLETYERDIKIYIREVLENNFSEEIEESQVQEVYNNMITFTKDKSAIILGAYDNEVLMGFLWAYRRTINSQKRYHINYFVVSSEKRSMGIGRGMFQELLNIGKNESIEAVELMVTATNEKARKFYNQCGFDIERVSLCKRL